MSFLPEDFLQYISPDCDRMQFIRDYLKKFGVDSAVCAIDGKNHILVQYASHFYNSQFKIKTVIAHYDRVAGSPGANDNSAADFQLMNWAVSLKNYQTFHNVRIFFTDGEELGWNTGVNEQGAYGIAQTFKRLGIVNDDVYVFDACGRGSVPVLSRTVIGEKAPSAFKKNFTDLFNRTQDLLRSVCPQGWMSLPVPYSDNASFIACGIPAVAITMLPADEASLYARELSSNHDLENAVLNRESSKKERMASHVPEYAYKERIPLTWRLFHTEKDNAASLTRDSFMVMSNILSGLAALKVPL
ncbi:M28 family peptidase [Treponema sp.]|uniref:M28 family peptidase n=1 Tax=Treponema sp. TaxID=166 RepID=UPI0025FA5494|nr:M28 family peptidase [Treponema sp.]MCR5218503.1 M28 family peptidase [Treponema sp.]